jgi:hypothetical protein
LGNVFCENSSFLGHNRLISTEFSNLPGRFVKARTIATNKGTGANFTDFAGGDGPGAVDSWALLVELAG